MKLNKQYTNQQEQIIGFEVAVRKGYYQNKEVNHYLGYSQTGTIDPNCKPPEPFDLAAITNARVCGSFVTSPIEKKLLSI
jgi:hypothetical protein